MKLQFNNEGFVVLQKQLYQMSDEALKIEAETLQYNFNTWLNRYFELDESQFNYLESMDAQLKKYLSYETSFAIENRFPITLNSAVTRERIIKYAACGTLYLYIRQERKPKNY